jgi:hypothetical protein
MPLPAWIAERKSAPHAVDVRVASADLPYFAEYAAYCWPHGAYTSRGDCARPADRRWNWLEVTRPGGESVLLFRGEGAREVRVEATSSRLVWLAALLTMRRADGVAFLRRRGHHIGAAAVAEQFLAGDDIDARWARAESVRSAFESEAARPFDTMESWSRWKHAGIAGT